MVKQTPLRITANGPPLHLQNTSCSNNGKVTSQLADWQAQYSRERVPVKWNQQLQKLLQIVNTLSW